MRSIKIMVCIILGLLSATSGAFLCLLQYPVLDFSPLEHYNPGKPSILLDDEGKEWGRFEIDRREPVALALLPQHLIDAFVAAEDHGFFSHYGISLRGILRSLLVNLWNRRIVQGASTITQQLVKLLFFEKSRTFKRKLKEQLAALLVEQHFTKEQILETYLNHTYFGCGIYGVEAAAQRFWGISARKVSLAQAALLARIVRSPSRYCPLICPEKALQGRLVILNSMYQLHMISQEEYDVAKTENLSLLSRSNNEIAPHLQEKIRLFLEELVGKKTLYTGGLQIQTTLNRKAQLHAMESFKRNITSLRKRYNPQIDGALVCLEPSTGALKAVIGGYDFKTSEFNRAFDARRQLGSLFKTLVYTVAVDQGASFSDTEIDEPFCMNSEKSFEWNPNNCNHRFEGPITLARALSRSNNIVAIKTLLKVGIPAVLDLARKAHLPLPVNAYPSLALGCLEASPVQAAAMFSLFSQGGTYTAPFYIEWVKDGLGSKIWKHKPLREKVLATKTANKIGRVLCAIISRVKGLSQALNGTACMGKTGTTNEARTCWFAGATPDLTTVVYIGHDKNEMLDNRVVYASQTAFPIWADFMRKLPLAKKQFNFDPSLKELTIDEFTGLPIPPGSPRSIVILTEKTA